MTRNLALIPFFICLLFAACAEKKPEYKHKHHHHGPKGKATKFRHHLHHGQVRHDFSDAAKWSKMFDDPARDAWQKPEEVVTAMKIKKGMVVADIGAGTGYFLPHLNKSVSPNGSVLALDVEKNLVAHMRKRIKRQQLKATEAKLIPMDSPGLDGQSVDRILIVDTWHHISDRGNYAKKLKASLKGSGELYIVDFEPGAKGPGPSQKHRLQAQAVVKELEAGGFKTKVIQEDLPYQYIVVGY